LLQGPNLAFQPVRDRQAGRIVASAVDAKTGRQLVQGLLEIGLVDAALLLGDDTRKVVDYTETTHVSFLLELGSGILAIVGLVRGRSGGPTSLKGLAE